VSTLADTVNPGVALIKSLEVSAYKIPTASPESDGTLSWDSTTLVLVEITAAGRRGLGYTYAHVSATTVISDLLQPLVMAGNAFDVPALHAKMTAAVRNNGQTGLAMMAISAVDNALWDLKAKLLGLPLCRLLGQARDGMLLYGSGGFTNYDKNQLKGQLAGWAEQGFGQVKIKIGSEPAQDVHRVREARNAIGKDTGLFVDANGAFSVKEALEKADRFREYDVGWFEEPVRSDDLAGLRRIRREAPSGMAIAAGEYGFNLPYYQQMLEASAVDVIQADATRCGGITNFLRAGALAAAWQIPFSSHCAPAIHLHAALSLPDFYIAEYFFDHARIEDILFDGMNPPVKSCLYPDLTRPGLGLEFRHRDAEKYRVS